MANKVDLTSFVSEEAKSPPKRIVICCDGTWQSSVSLDPKKGIESNVTRLARVLAPAGTDKDGKVWEQVVYYDAGVGAGDVTAFDAKRQGMYSPFSNLRRELTIRIGGLGIGLNENVLEAYNFIASNYKKGDELFFFGFSRGAYTVRATAGFVGQLGVLRPGSMAPFIHCYAEFKKIEEQRPNFNEFPPWVKFIKENPDYRTEKKEDVVIQVIGVWDTVGSLGVPELGHFWTVRKADSKHYEFYDTNLSTGRRIQNFPTMTNIIRNQTRFPGPSTGRETTCVQSHHLEA